MKYLIAIPFPFIPFFYIKKPVLGYICFVLQVFVLLAAALYPNIVILFILWFVLDLWSFFEINDYNNKSITEATLDTNFSKVQKLVSSDFKKHKEKEEDISLDQEYLDDQRDEYNADAEEDDLMQEDRERFEEGMHDSEYEEGSRNIKSREAKRSRGRENITLDDELDEDDLFYEQANNERRYKEKFLRSREEEQYVDKPSRASSRRQVPTRRSRLRSKIEQNRYNDEREEQSFYEGSSNRNSYDNDDRRSYDQYPSNDNRSSDYSPRRVNRSYNARETSDRYLTSVHEKYLPNAGSSMVSSSLDQNSRYQPLSSRLDNGNPSNSYDRAQPKSGKYSKTTRAPNMYDQGRLNNNNNNTIVDNRNRRRI